MRYLFANTKNYKKLFNRQYFKYKYQTKYWLIQVNIYLLHNNSSYNLFTYFLKNQKLLLNKKVITNLFIEERKTSFCLQS